MMNRDYILRMAEQLGRQLAIILRLRKFDRNEEALIYIDELMLKMTGMTSRFADSLPEDTLLQALSPMGKLNVESCLWMAVLLKTEAEIYEQMGKTKESYYRYVKALHLLITALLNEPLPEETEFQEDATTLLQRLEEYDIPDSTKTLLFTYYERMGHYAKAEDTLFELLESADTARRSQLIEQGEAFYARLLVKSRTDLQAGNLSHEEVKEGLAQLRRQGR